MATPTPNDSPTAQINVGIYNGTRNLFPDNTQVLYRLQNNRQWQWQPANPFGPPLMRFTALPVRDNPIDDTYTVMAAIDGYGTCGYTPIHITAHSVTIVNLMLLPQQYNFDFTNAAWNLLQQNKPRIWKLLAGRAADQANGNPQAQGIYQGLLGGAIGDQKKAACLLNILTAMDQIQLSGNKTPLDYLRDIDWAYQMAQDRFYCWVDTGLVDAIRAAGSLFAQELNPSIFHGGTADLSWKEAEYGEANVQFTFHSSVKSPQNPNWIRLEPDIDYFKDLAAHFFGEVAVNWFGSLTEPEQVYKLRWEDGSKPGSLPFDPPYIIA
jgi:hypothetical protein